jgi:hypothetical protein
VPTFSVEVLPKRALDHDASPVARDGFCAGGLDDLPSNARCYPSCRCLQHLVCVP